MYKTLNRLIDWFTGFNLDHATKLSIDFDYLTREQIDSYQKEKFQKLSKIAASSDYYKKYINKSYNEYPLITRDEYQKNVSRMLTDCNQQYQARFSSGSTGTPVKQFVTRDMLLAKRSSHQKMLKWYGLDRESSEFKIGGLPTNIKTRIYYLLRNKRYFDSYYISTNTLPKIIRSFNRFKPEILYGYPSAINLLMIFANSNNIKLHEPKIVVTHAENLYLEIKQNIRQAFPNAKIVNQYWTTESNIGVTCPHGNLHIDEDTVICEVINANKNGFGDLYITNLHSYKVPIIRYKNGDRIKISDKLCNCGRNTKIIESIEGRTNETLDLPNGNKFPITAIHHLGIFDNVLYYQLVYLKNEQKIIFKYKRVNNLPIKKKIIESYIREKFNLGVEFKEVAEIEFTTGGKYKKLITID